MLILTGIGFGNPMRQKMNKLTNNNNDNETETFNDACSTDADGHERNGAE